MWAHVASVAAILGATACAVRFAPTRRPWCLRAAATLVASTALLDVLPDALRVFGIENALLATAQLAVVLHALHARVHGAKETAPFLVSDAICQPCEQEEAATRPASACACHAPPRASSTLAAGTLCWRVAPLLMHVGIDASILGAVHGPRAIIHLTLAVGVCIAQDSVALVVLLQSCGVRRPRAWACALVAAVVILGVLPLAALATSEYGTSEVRAGVCLVAVACSPLLAWELWPRSRSLREAAQGAALVSCGMWYTWTLTRL